MYSCCLPLLWVHGSVIFRVYVFVFILFLQWICASRKSCLYWHLVFRRVAMLPSSLSIFRSNYSRNFAVGPWCKMWKHCEGRGTFKFSTFTSEVNITTVFCSEKVDHQRRLEAFLANWWRDRITPTVPDVGFSCDDEHSSQKCLLVERRYWAREQCFYPPWHMRHNELIWW